MSLIAPETLLQSCKAQGKKVLGLDLGREFIGMALGKFAKSVIGISNLGSITPTPPGNFDDIKEIKQYIEDHDVGGVLIGDPRVKSYSHSSEKLTLTQLTREFMAKFTQEININYAFQNESFSTKMVMEKMRQFHIALEKPELDIESAAMIISQCVIDNHEQILGEEICLGGERFTLTSD